MRLLPPFPSLFGARFPVPGGGKWPAVSPRAMGCLLVSNDDCAAIPVGASVNYNTKTKSNVGLYASKRNNTLAEQD